MKADPIYKVAYDALANDYARMIDTKPHNAFYDRPAVQSLLYDLEGKDILDAGCGTGVYTAWLLERNAHVVALDGNEHMLRHAKQRVGDRATYIQANLEEPLDFFPNGSFDGIVSPLTLTYCNDLNATFAEFARILRPNGWLVFSTEHPFFAYTYHALENYYETKAVSCTWTGFGEPVEMHSYYHSLGNIVGALTSNGFLIEQILEPKPTEAFKQADRAGYEKLMKFPLFIVIRAMRRG